MTPVGIGRPSVSFVERPAAGLLLPRGWTVCYARQWRTYGCAKRLDFLDSIHVPRGGFPGQFLKSCSFLSICIALERSRPRDGVARGTPGAGVETICVLCRWQELPVSTGGVDLFALCWGVLNHLTESRGDTWVRCRGRLRSLPVAEVSPFLSGGWFNLYCAGALSTS